MTRYYDIDKSLTLATAISLPQAEDPPLTLDEVLDLLTKTELRLFAKLDRWIESKIKRGEEAYVCPSRAWIAQHLGNCTPRTVTTALARFKALGLFVVQERYRGGRYGLRRQLTNLIARPFRRPDRRRSEVEKICHRTKNIKTGIKKKVGLRPFFRPRREKKSDFQHITGPITALMAQIKEGGLEIQQR